MRSFLHSRLRSFGYAFDGWWFVLRTQPNAWIHAAASAAVLVVGWWLRLSARDWAMIVVAFALVWTAEFFNTALEALVDLVSPGQHELARISKDVSAAAVLIAAVAAILIGLLILGPPLWQRLLDIFRVAQSGS